MSEKWKEMKKRRSWRDGVDENALDWMFGILFQAAWIVPLVVLHILKVL